MLPRQATGTALWGIFAELSALEGDHVVALECVLKQVRGLQGAGWQDDPERFKALAKVRIWHAYGTWHAYRA